MSSLHGVVCVRNRGRWYIKIFFARAKSGPCLQDVVLVSAGVLVHLAHTIALPPPSHTIAPPTARAYYRLTHRRATHCPTTAAHLIPHHLRAPYPPPPRHTTMPRRRHAPYRPPLPRTLSPPSPRYIPQHPPPPPPIVSSTTNATHRIIHRHHGVSYHPPPPPSIVSTTRTSWY